MPGRIRSASLLIIASAAAATLFGCTSGSSPPAPAPMRSARAPGAPPLVVAAALDAMGGEARLRAIRSVHLKAVGTWSSVGTSDDRPEPPWHRIYDRTEQWLDYERGAWRKEGEFLSVDGRWRAFTIIAADGASAIEMDGKVQPGGPVYLGDAADELLYQPYRLLLAAADATDLRSDGDEQVAGQPNHVVAFHHAGRPIRLWINAYTRRLSVAEIIHTMPDDYFWRVRGDIRDRLDFLQWTLHPSGIWFAHQYDLTREGIPYHSFALTLIEPNAMKQNAFVIPDDVRAAYKANPRGPAATPARGEKPIVEIAPGVWFAAAGWNALLIAQPTGALLVDAPISEVYVGRALDEVQHRFGRPAAAVILTDHVIPELSGVREAATRGVAVRTLDANRSFVAQLLAAPHTIAPDALARSGRRATVEAVAARTALGDGAMRVELIPMRSTLGERVLLVWLPVPRLLWVASALILDSDGRADPSRLAELTAVIAREHLDVDKVVGARLSPTLWASVH